jgi:hypothetical protein
MIPKFKLLPLALIAILALVLAACGGGGEPTDSGADSPNRSPPERDVEDGGTGGADTDEDLFISTGGEVLTRSVDSFAGGEVMSMSGDVAFEFSMGTTAVKGDADFAYQDPGLMHMALTVEGGDQTSVVDLSQFGALEVLARDGSFYMNIPFLGGWFVMAPEDMREGSEAIADILSRGSLFDYEAFVGQLGEDVQYIGDEDVNGHSTAHYQITADLQSLIGSFADALGATGDNAFADQILESQLNGPISVDLWVGKDDFLPYKMDASATIETGQPGAGAMVLSLSANFDNYNEPVDIPAAPADATSFADVLGGLGLDPDAPPTE